MNDRIDYLQTTERTARKPVDLTNCRRMLFRLNKLSAAGDEWVLVVGHPFHEERVALNTEDVRRLISDAHARNPGPGEAVEVSVGNLRLTLDRGQWTRIQDYLSMFGEV